MMHLRTPAAEAALSGGGRSKGTELETLLVRLRGVGVLSCA